MSNRKCKVTKRPSGDPANFDQAATAYRRALEIEPSLVSARVLYGQLLHDRIMPRAAEEHLRYAWEHGAGSTAASPGIAWTAAREPSCTG